MIRRPPRSTRTDTLFPYTTLFRSDKALGIYREVVNTLAGAQRSTTGMANMMAPYYRLLAERAASDPSAVADFFVASQLQVRTGIADTQARSEERSVGKECGSTGSSRWLPYH